MHENRVLAPGFTPLGNLFMWEDMIRSDPWKALECIFHAGFLGWGHTSSLQKPGPWLCLPHRFLSLASSSSCCDEFHIPCPPSRQGVWNSQGAVGTRPRVYLLPIKRNYTSQTPSPHNTAPWFSTLCYGYYTKATVTHCDEKSGQENHLSQWCSCESQTLRLLSL